MNPLPPDDLDPAFAAGLRAALVSRVAASAPASSAPTARRSARRRPWFLGLGLGAGLLLAGGAAAAISGLLPGSDDVTTYGAPTTQTLTGTSAVDLGPRPAGATHVTLAFSCLSADRFEFADGSSVSCRASEIGASASTVLELAADATTTTITTSADARWTATAQYASVEITPWGVNAAGQTYGIQNENGVPDLIAVHASNGLRGYAFATDVDNPWGTEPTSPAHALALQAAHDGEQISVPVYESDGSTVIGEFLIG